MTTGTHTTNWLEQAARIRSNHEEQLASMNKQARLDLLSEELAKDKTVKKLAKAKPLSSTMSIKSMDTVQKAENIAKERNRAALHDLKARQKRTKAKLLHATKKERLALSGEAVKLDSSFSAHRKLKASLYKARKTQAIGMNEGLTAKH